MKLSFLKYLTAVVLALVVQHAAAQESGSQDPTDMRETVIPAGPHSFHVEIAGIGYQYSANRFFFRVTGYILSMPGPSDWFPDYIPWGGISTGW